MNNIYFKLPAPDPIEDAFLCEWTISAWKRGGPTHYFGCSTHSEALPLARELRRRGTYDKVVLQNCETIVGF